ncbi:hypothetical protein FOZ61_000367 [Perkinsus olseni]|uniref:Uncharacterized protein n=1 Tax=Perkinsus olseni TaxID=32597 RepID=A0A7J6M0H0_PEROL|nr:hypothetical protein FOZ61_000367 [Perkinsus olseni]
MSIIHRTRQDGTLLRAPRACPAVLLKFRSLSSTGLIPRNFCSTVELCSPSNQGNSFPTSFASIAAPKGFEFAVSRIGYYYNVQTGTIQWEHPGPDAVVTAVSLGPDSSTSGSRLSADGLVAQLASEIHALCNSEAVRTHGQREIIWKTAVKATKPPPAPPFPDSSPVDSAPSSEPRSTKVKPANKSRKFQRSGVYDDLPVRLRSVINAIVNDPRKVARLDQDRFEARLEDFRAGGLDEDYFYQQLVAERDAVDVKHMTSTASTMDSRAGTREVVEAAFIAVERCDDPKQLTDILALCDIDCSTSLLAGYTILMTAAVLHRPGPIISVLASWPFTCRADVVNPHTGDNVFHLLVREAADIITERSFTDFVNAYVGASPDSVPIHVKSAMNQYTRMDGGATPVLLAVMPANGVVRTDTMVSRLVGRLHDLGAECTQPLLESGDTPLHFAARHGYRKTVELLLSAGVNSQENKAGELPEDVTDNITILDLLRAARDEGKGNSAVSTVS